MIMNYIEHAFLFFSNYFKLEFVSQLLFSMILLNAYIAFKIVFFR